MSSIQKEKCIENKKFGEYQVLGILGKGKYSKVYKICKQKSCFALKEIKTKNTTFISRNKSSSEILFLYFCQQLNKAGLTENLQDTIDFYKCHKCDSLYTESEILFGDCWKFFKIKHSVKVWRNFYFQILAGLYTFQRYLDGVHFDLHPGNILFTIDKPNVNGYKIYIINKKKYYLPDTGYTFKISDFGISYSKSLGIFNKNRMYAYKEYLFAGKGAYFDTKEIDALILSQSYYQNVKKENKVKEIEYFLDYWEYLIFEKNIKYTFDLISELFIEYTIKPKNAKIIKTFDLDKKFLVKLF